VEVIQLDSVVASATTDADGNFTLTASAGPSLIRATATEGLPSVDSLTVDLSAGKTTTVQLMLDTGIR